MTREQMREHARQVVADWPPLTPEQRDHLAVLFRPAMQEVRARKQQAA